MLSHLKRVGTLAQIICYFDRTQHTDGVAFLIMLPDRRICLRISCGAILVALCLVFLWPNIAVHSPFNRATFHPKSRTSSIRVTKSVQKCLSHVLKHFSLRDLVFLDKGKKLISPVIRQSIPPYPLDKVRAAFRNLFEPLYANRSSQTEKELSCYLKYTLKPRLRQLRSIVFHVVQAFKREKIDLILDSGSLIGSWRHHGIIPYDDDIDFRFPYDQRPRVFKLLNSLCAKQGTCWPKKYNPWQWKLYVDCKKHTKKNCSTQIDFFFYKIKENLIKQEDRPFSYNKSVFFPLTQRPFEGVLMKSVRDYPGYFQRMYKSKNLTECRSFNHVHQSRCKRKAIDCNLLQPFHPFVRSFSDKRWRSLEFLIHKRKIVHVFYDPNKNIH